MRSGTAFQWRPKPLFPEDLRQTIHDLENVGERGISCSVVWPEHQETFGPIGIIVDPRAVSSIKLMHTGDAGYSDTNGGMGSAPSEQALHETFEKSNGHNEWVITQADVRGIFLNLTGALEVAHEATIEDLTEESQALMGGAIIAPRTIEIPEIIDEFPDLPLFGFIRDCLVELSARHPLT